MTKTNTQIAIEVHQNNINFGAYLLGLNSFVSILNAFEVFEHLPKMLASFMGILNAVVIAGLLIYMIIEFRKSAKYPLPENYKQTPEYKALKARTNNYYSLNAVVVFLGFLTISGSVAKNSLSQIPIMVLIALFSTLLVLVLWIFEAIGKIQRETLNDELIELKYKNSGYFGFYIGLFLLMALMLTMLWMPEAKAQIIKHFAGFEIEIAISFSIFALLIGGLLGRFATWDKYR